MKRTIVWFTTDLRIHDNETLTQAIIQSDEIIPNLFSFAILNTDVFE
jgi:deoxyribodipyrimidine photolyase